MKKFTRLTTSLDSFFQLNTRKIFTQASYLLGSHAFGNLLSFIVAITAAHFVSKEVYGTYRYILSIVGFISAFSLTGLGTAIVRSVARGYDRIFVTSFLRSLLWSSPAIIIGIGAGAWYLYQGNLVLGFSVLIGGLLFPLVQSLLWYRSYLNGKKYFKAIMKANMAYSAVTSSVLIATLLMGPSVIMLVCAYYISNIVILIILTVIIKKRFKPNNEEDPEPGKLEHHMSLMNILDIGATQLDKIILFQIAGPVEVARYAFATLIPEQLRNVVKYASTLSMPIFSSLEKKVARSKGLFLAQRLFLVTIPLVILYYFISPYIYKIFFPSYAEVVDYSRMFALILLFDGGITGTVLKSQNEVKKLYAVNVTSNIIKIILMIALGLMMGIWGIIISRALSRALSFSISYIALRKT